MADTSTSNPTLGAFKSTASKPTVPTPKPVVVKKDNVPKDPKGMFDWSDAKSYKVQDGESLFDVAQKYSVALQQLRYFNHIDKTTMKVRAGQTIYIPNKPVNIPYGA